MSDVERLQQWFSGGTLLRPNLTPTNILDLSATIRRTTGTPGLPPETEQQSAVRTHVGESDHFVFVLVDGFGANLLQRLEPGSFFRQHCVMELRTVFPSSTAPCLTSLATGLWPASHGVPGWFMFLEAPQRSMLVLPFAERASELDARMFGISSEDVFQAPVQTARMPRARHWVIPRKLAGSVFTTYSCAGAKQVPYHKLPDAITQIERIIERSTSETYTYWYISDVDYVEHARGASHKDVAATLRRVEAAIEMLSERIHGRGRIIVTADHGQIDIPDDQRHMLPPEHPLMRHLLAPPSCEPRVPAFHVRPDLHDEFVREFRERFGETWLLLTINEADDLRLFGPEPISDLTRARLGTFIALNDSHEIIMAAPTRKHEPLLGSHGGLLPDEMLVPLIVA